MKTRKTTELMVLGAFFLALGLVLPFLTAQVPQIGNKLLPMHIPVLLCGFVCGWKYGLAVGLVVPLLRSMMFGMPPLFPVATAMAFELAAYGAFSGLLYERLPKNKVSVYGALVGAMIAGRVVWGIVNIPIYGMAGNPYSWQIFMAGAVLNAIPGIILQILLIPLIILSLEKSGVMRVQTA